MNAIFWTQFLDQCYFLDISNILSDVFQILREIGTSKKIISLSYKLREMINKKGALKILMHHKNGKALVKIR